MLWYKKGYFFVLIAFLGIFEVACDNSIPQAKIIIVDKKMPLTEWPDSIYISELDSILALEPLKKVEKNKPNIAMNAFKAPNFILPSSVTGKSDSQKTKTNRPQKPNGSETKRTQDKSAENFANKFSNALSALQSDPSNSSLYKIVEAKSNEDLFQLLRRTYGGASQNLPRFYVLSVLQSVNSGVMLEHLNEGDKVKVPRI